MLTWTYGIVGYLFSMQVSCRFSGVACNPKMAHAVFGVMRWQREQYHVSYKAVGPKRQKYSVLSNDETVGSRGLETEHYGIASALF